MTNQTASVAALYIANCKSTLLVSASISAKCLRPRCFHHLRYEEVGNSTWQHPHVTIKHGIPADHIAETWVLGEESVFVGVNHWSQVWLGEVLG